MIKVRTFKIFILLFTFFLNSLYASATVIDKDTTHINILKNSYIYVENTSENSFENIFKNPELFSSLSSENINLGYIVNSTIWLKFSIHNNSDIPISKLLVYDNPNTNIVNLFFEKKSEIRSIQNGVYNRHDFDNKLFFSFPIKLDANEVRTYYLKIKSQTHSSHFFLSIQDEKTYFKQEFKHQIILAIFFAALSVILVFNFVLFLFTKERINLYYVLFILSLYIYHLSFTGIIAYFIPKNMELIQLQSHLHIYYTAFLLFSVLLFVREFLQTKQVVLIDSLFKIYIFLLFTVLGFNIFGFPTLELTVYLALLGAMTLIVVGLYFLIKFRTLNTKYFFFVWTIPLLGYIYITLYDLGFLQVVVPYTFELSVSIEKILFSSILITQIYNLKNEKLLLSLQLSEQKKQELEKDKMILEQSKLAAMGEMIRNITHQWRQPLSEINAVTMKIDADYFKNRLTQESLEKDISRIENLTGHMSQTVENFNSYFKEDKRLDNVTPQMALEKVLDISKGAIENNHIEVILDIQNNTSFKTYLGELIQVLLVIINNAVDVLQEVNQDKKLIKITVVKNTSKYYITIEDNAGGIHVKPIEKIFEPFFTTKFQANGTGVGLYMSKMIIEQSLQGSLSVQNTKAGAKFTISI